jgi:hypothetical protein
MTQMTTAPDYNLATVSAEAIAGICHRVSALQIVGSDFAPYMAREIDARFRDLAERLGYTVERLPAPAVQAAE